MDESPAVNTDGTLKDAKEIAFYDSESDIHPIGSSVRVDSIPAVTLARMFFF